MRYTVLFLAFALSGCAPFIRSFKGGPPAWMNPYTKTESSILGDRVTVEIMDTDGAPRADPLISEIRVQFPRMSFTEPVVSADQGLRICSIPIGNMGGSILGQNEGEDRRRYEATRTCGEILWWMQGQGWLSHGP